jgi:hypothetical protein
MTFANELAEVLDDGDNLRVIPIVTWPEGGSGKGSRAGSWVKKLE